MLVTFKLVDWQIVKELWANSISALISLVAQTAVTGYNVKKYQVNSITSYISIILFYFIS